MLSDQQVTTPVVCNGASTCDPSHFRPGAWWGSRLLAAARLYKRVCIFKRTSQ